MSEYSPFGEAAIALAEIGVAVFRLQPRDKRPFPGTAGFKDASRDVMATARRWREQPYANVGIATGAVSGFWVLDVDGPEAEAALDVLVAQHGEIPETVEQQTGRGRHLCFLWPEACAAGDGVHNSAGQIGPHIDVRGCGGYIVAPPSVHPSGRVYAWNAGRSPFEIPFAFAPAWLWDMAMPKKVEPRPLAERAVFKPTIGGGQATPYGEAALTRACADISMAAAGTVNMTRWKRSCAIGCLIAGGEINAAYGRNALIQAGLANPGAGPEKKIVSSVLRALRWAESFPRRAPERVDTRTGEVLTREPRFRDVRRAAAVAPAQEPDEPVNDPSWPPVLDERDDMFDFINGAGSMRQHPWLKGQWGGNYVSSVRARRRRARD